LRACTPWATPSLPGTSFPSLSDSVFVRQRGNAALERVLLPATALLQVGVLSLFFVDD